MALIYEHGERAEFKNRARLESLLRDIWYARHFPGYDGSNEAIGNSTSGYQPFLTFDGVLGRANNYVGFIQDNDELIEIYPKVFKYHQGISKELMLEHIFYWFSHCRKGRFPFSKATLGSINVNSFPELIIFLIARDFLEKLSEHPLHTYQAVEEALITPRGAINFKRYTSHSLSHGNYHRIECNYEPWAFDNAVNRTIKHYSRLLLAQTHQVGTLKLLQEVIAMLDEVEDHVPSLADLAKISLNPFYADYDSIIDYCNLILSRELYSNNSNDLSQWSLLFPMEYIFEDFVAEFLDDMLPSSWRVEYQKSEMYLSDTPHHVFRMQHDIFLTHGDRKIIVDTKYKLRDGGFKSDPKKGIAQSDLYQMTSYAFKRGCTDVLLIYPNVSESIEAEDRFEIRSGFEGNEVISIVAMEIPFWSATRSFAEIDQELGEVLKSRLDKFVE